MYALVLIVALLGAVSTTLHIYQREDWFAIPEVDPDPLHTPVPYVMIAHTVTAECTNLDTCRNILRTAQNQHMSYNWGDIAYNFMVGGDGYVYVGRGWDNLATHTLGYNTCSIGIAFIGTFTSTRPPQQQLNAALSLIAEGVRLGKIRSDYRLLGQNQVTPTESPGRALFDALTKLPHFSLRGLSCATVEADMNAAQITSTTSSPETTTEGTTPTTAQESSSRRTPSTKAPVVGVRPGATCAPLIDASVSLDCNLAGDSVNCSLPMRVDTQAYMTCAVGYVPTHHHGYHSITCRSSLTWSRPIITCIPDCGRSNAGGGQATLSRGQDVQVGEFSWHVGIYELITLPPPNSTQLFEQICGGSLITPAFVLSAAHCFWDLHDDVNHVKDKLLYRIAAGKYQRDWYFEDRKVQRRNLSEIHLHPRFDGDTLFLAYDIAVVKLADDVILSLLVNTVCIDFDYRLEDSQLRSGKNGSIAGWGVTEHNEQSEVLKSVKLPYIPVEDCKDIVNVKFKKYLAHDKICAGYRNQGTSICPGDSGGAYVFPQETPRGTRYYIRGIASVAQRPSANSGIRCLTDQVAALTKVSVHRSLIENLAFLLTPE